MRQRGLFFISVLILLFSPSTRACREPDWTHEEWVQNSDVALTAVVSGIYVPALEKQGYDEVNAGIVSIYSTHVVRMKVVQVHKGRAPRVLKLTLGNCQGSVYAAVGRPVHAYRDGNGWLLAPIETEEPTAIALPPTLHSGRRSGLSPSLQRQTGRQSTAHLNSIVRRQ